MASKKLTRKAIRNIFDQEGGDGLVNTEDYRNGNGKLELRAFVNKKDGVYEIRESFFYRHGRTEQDWRAKVEKFATENNLTIEVTETGEEWKTYPQTSYWWVRFTVTQ